MGEIQKCKIYEVWEMKRAFSIQQEHGGMRGNQIAPHCYDCQRLQQEQAPEQWEGGMGGRK